MVTSWWNYFSLCSSWWYVKPISSKIKHWEQNKMLSTERRNVSYAYFLILRKNEKIELIFCSNFCPLIWTKDWEKISFLPFSVVVEFQKRTNIANKNREQRAVIDEWWTISCFPSLGLLFGSELEMFLLIQKLCFVNFSNHF